MRITCRKSDGRTDYFPVFLGNGSLSALLDYEGAMNQRPLAGNSIPNPEFVKAGCRYGDCYRRDLVPLGKLTQSVSGPGGEAAVEDWAQSFDPERAVTECRAVYAGGTVVETTAFVPFGADAIVLRKRITAPGAFTFRFAYTLSPDGTAGLPRRIRLTDDPDRGLSFEVDGIRPFCFRVTLDADAGCVIREENRLTLTLSAEREAGVEIVLNLTEREEQPLAFAPFSDLLAAHEADSLAFAAQGWVRTGDTALDAAFATAAYHLRASMTRWSMPTGLFRSHWDAKFFGFDEYFSLAGLLAANHPEVARHTSDFRFEMLPTAIRRASSGRGERREAHYCWETIENFEEASTPGFWFEHIFHMANIPLGAYKVARFTDDDAYLREKALPMLRACCCRFTEHYVTREYAPDSPRGYRYVIVPVTDLERLGQSHRNAYMTTCSVIATLRAFVDTVRRLSSAEDEAYAAECEALAEELLRDLPVEDGRYVPYPGCPQKSIAVATGTFPYEVIAHDDPRQLAALKDYEAHELEYGNMYAVGSGIGAWYALWKAMLYARLSDGDGAFGAIRQAVGTTGAFGEMWEINEAPKTAFRPWFTTSSGILLSALGEAFCRREGDTLCLCSAVPEELVTFSFRLAALGGLVVECEVKEEKVVKLEIEGDASGVTVVLPPRFRR